VDTVIRKQLFLVLSVKLKTTKKIG